MKRVSHRYKPNMKLGSHNVICDRCKFTFKAEETTKEKFTSAVVCFDCLDKNLNDYTPEKVYVPDRIFTVQDARPDDYTPPTAQDLIISPSGG
jgi:hypothetical protein